jgi:hypothetical protein
VHHRAKVDKPVAMFLALKEILLLQKNIYTVDIKKSTINYHIN